MKYNVFVTPASGVGGEYPEAARRNVSKKEADSYANFCQALGQKTRIVPVSTKDVK